MGGQRGVVKKGRPGGGMTENRLSWNPEHGGHLSILPAGRRWDPSFRNDSKAEYGRSRMRIRMQER